MIIRDIGGDVPLVFTPDDKSTHRHFLFGGFRLTDFQRGERYASYIDAIICR
jgi:hypothetical protein